MAEDSTTRKSQLKSLSTLILHIDKQYQRRLGRIRTIPNCWVAEEERILWLKVEIEGDTIPMAIQQLPAKGRFWADEATRLFPIGGLTPVAQLPDLNWLPIASFIAIELPVAALPAQVAELFSIHLIRSVEPKEANFLLLSWDLWKDYALATSNIRLKPLSFAVSDEKKAIVYGNPLPPLPGQLFWQKERILLPAGWDFEYSIVAEILSSTQLKGKNGLLLSEADQLSKLPSTKDFINASRSGIRNTEEHLKTLLSP